MFYNHNLASLLPPAQVRTFAMLLVPSAESYKRCLRIGYKFNVFINGFVKIG